MTAQTRLPQPPATVGELVDRAAQAYGSATAIRAKRGGQWQELSYVDLAARVHEVAAGLRAAGIRPGDRVGLLSETRPEWTVVDLAIAHCGAVCVPIYPTNSAAECEWVLSDSGARAVVYEDAAHLAKITEVRANLPELALVVCIEELDGLAVPGARRAPEPVRVSEPATIVYTSGTTGPPKGCLLTHANWRAALDSISGATTMGPGDAVYLYLPLAHLFARMVQLTTFECGATLCYFGGDVRQVVTELTEIRPTHLPSVPRLFEKVYRIASAQSLPPEQLAEAVRAAFGGRLREALTGAAPIAVEILEFFRECGIPVYEAYGMTESTALISANVPGGVRLGTVGRPLPGIEVRIAEDGEVLAKGANVFPGYHHNESATAEALDGGWLHTGDLGALDEDGFLSITGRKKDIIITSGGKNLTPANIENDLRRSPWISHAVLHGDRRPFAVALITLDSEAVLPWARQRGLPEQIPLLAQHPEVRELIEQAVREANANYAPPERIRGFAVLAADFSVAAGELTPTAKMRRSVINRRYAEVIDALYAQMC
ncbi:long-chain acyl-CoA synthetase [Kutzneria viridogrisea]|uniref:Acyl-CoA synthetase n=1 Tax=Kutzneria viridogrisea TaxID=47990 RepID=A0ABR6BMS7_9PSEU|nr:long-chain acyl-CoA synthetase [Kutzneria viridogrisea]